VKSLPEALKFYRAFVVFHLPRGLERRQLNMQTLKIEDPAQAKEYFETKIAIADFSRTSKDS
jgi:hypothetical protein